LKAGLDPFLEFQEELATLSGFRHIHEHANEIISIDLTFVLPVAADDLRFRRNRPKLLP
jgi:hypothetical protein